MSDEQVIEGLRVIREFIEQVNQYLDAVEEAEEDRDV